MGAILAVLLAGGVVTEMTPELIREAITYGAATKKVKPYRLGPAEAPAEWMMSQPPIAIYTTPFLRVALASHEAKVTYKEFSEKDVTPEMLIPEMIVVAGAVAMGQNINGVKAMVIVSADGKVNQPDRIEDMDQKFSNAFGAVNAGRGLIAHFPLSAIQEGAEIRIVMEIGKEKKAKFKTEKVR